MNPGARFILLLAGGLWLPVGLRSGWELASSNHIPHASWAGLVALAAGLIAFGLPWAAALFLSRLRPPRLAAVAATAVLFVPWWGALRWANLHLLPVRRVGLLFWLGNLGLLAVLGLLAILLLAAAVFLGPRLVRGSRPLFGRPAFRAAIMVLCWLAAAPLVTPGARAPHPGPLATDGTGRRICLFGVDGASWEVMAPMLARGELPHFRALMNEGHFGPLATLQGWPSSPVLWTTIATGMLPRHHGVQDFIARLYRLPLTGSWVTVPPSLHSAYLAQALEVAAALRLGARQVVPVNGSMRRAAALWEVLTAAGRRSLVVNWWATWPAEPIAGVMVSDITDLLAARGLQVAEPEEGYGYLEHIPYAVHPPGARGEVLEILRASVDEVQAGAWKELLGAAPAGAASAAAPDTAAPGGRASPPPNLGLLDPDDPASYVRHAYRSDLATLHLARHFLEKEQDFDLVALYFRGLDSVEHFLWDALEPDFFPADSPAARDAALADAIPAYYRMLDHILGEMRALLGPETVFIIVSDHGHRRAWPPGIDGRHRGTHSLTPSPDGILIVGGPGLRAERRVMITGATLADVAPTALYLLGMPLARNLDGRVLADVVGPEALARRPPGQVPAFARLAARETSAGPTPEVDRQGLDRLRSLGYLR